MRILVVIVLMLPLLLLLGAIIRFSIVSPARLRGATARLRHPEPEAVEKICGFPLPASLAALYREAPFITQGEFYLVDTSKQPPVEWFIGSFFPLTKLDVSEQRKVFGIRDAIPIADDLDKGVYVVDRSGAVKLRLPGRPPKSKEVSKTVAAFAAFEAKEEAIEGNGT